MTEGGQDHLHRDPLTNLAGTPMTVTLSNGSVITTERARPAAASARDPSQ
ncbi:hypothetical protein [Pseudomonas sp. BIC9C]|nr:hypothetical protein [Pseudomonas sp. BIC9C]